MAALGALRLLLAALLLPPPAAAAPPGAPLRCELLVAGGGGGGGGLPGATGEPRPALLRLRGDTGDTSDTGDTEPELALVLDVSDPTGALLEVAMTMTTPAGGGTGGTGGTPPGTPPGCELSPAAPEGGAAPWARALAPQRRSPPELAGTWWVATATAATAATAPGLGVSALLQGPPRADDDDAAAADATVVTTANVALAVFSRTPAVTWRPGDAGLLHCAFAGPPGPFAVEWRHQHRGAGRVLLAYDAAAARAPVAREGAELLLGTAGDVTEVSLRLRPLAVAHEGTYICTVYLPHFHAQQILRVRVLEPPKVTLLPNPLVVAPGSAAELLCDISGYYPLDVAVTWQRQAGDTGVPLPLQDTWTSGHYLGPNGTFSRRSGARLSPAQLHHGDTYACVVTHVGLPAPLRVTVQVQVAGTAGPSLEDAVGLFLVAFVLYGLFQWLRGFASCPQSPDKSQPCPPRQKSE